MRGLRFFKLSPGGNSTILILDPVPAGERAPTARRLMDVHHLQAEQVGYLDLHVRPVRLDMMGGEFCGNACRAAAAVMLRENPALFMKETDGSLHANISVSGVEKVLRVKTVSGPHGHEYWARMPLPSSPEMAAELAPGVGLVSLPGITHLCLDQTTHPFPADWAAQASGLRRKYRAAPCPHFPERLLHRRERRSQEAAPLSARLSQACNTARAFFHILPQLLASNFP